MPNLKQRADWPGTIGSASKTSIPLIFVGHHGFPPIHCHVLPRCSLRAGTPQKPGLKLLQSS